MSRPLPLAPGPELAGADFARYSRQIVLPEFGVLGQRRLGAARVLVIGAGGLGSPALLYLAAAGVGTLGVVDYDEVELSNLHRQVIHSTAAVGTGKVASAVTAIAALNPGVDVVRHDVRLDEGNVDELVAGYDVVLDGTDNFATRYLVNDACGRAGVPLVWAAVLGFSAQLAVFWPAAPDGVQLRDLFPAPPAPGTVPSCSEAGVIGALCGQVGSIMATEAIKLLTGIGRPLLGRVLVIDALHATWDELPLRPSEPTGAPAAAPATSSQLACSAPATAAAGLVALPEALAGGFLLDVREPAEFAESRIDGSLNIPLARVLAGEDPPVAACDPVLVVCRSGKRATLAAAALAARGFSEVRVLDGGLLALAPRD